jgi:gliding motility-associated-like protein
MAVLPVSTMAQDFSGYNWYFGNAQRDLRFSRSTQQPVIASNQFLPFGAGGSAVASNPITGNLVFYTDGNVVVDASHQQVPGLGGVLGGDNTRNQPVVICRNQAIKGQYFIFYANGGGTVQFAVYDSAQVGNASTFQQPPLGDLILSNQAIAGLPGAGLSEGMAMVYDQANNSFWLITHQTGTNTYHFVRINKTGIAYQGSVSVGFIQNVANIAYNARTRRFAVSPKEANRDVEILNITFPTAPATLPTLASTTVLNSNSNTGGTQAIYDAEFSPNGQYLYVSVFNNAPNGGDLLQYDLAAQSQVPLPSPVSILPARPTESYGLQMGPDSVIYHLYQSGAQFFLGAVNRPDSPAIAVNYNPIAFAGNFGGRQFPSFAPADSAKMKVYFEAIGLCANSPTSFFPTIQPNADSLVWDFGDGQASSDWSPVHTYQNAATVNVHLTAYLNGQAKDTTQSITIQQFQTQITLVQDTTACSCELAFPKSTKPKPPGASTPCNPFQLTAQVQGGSPSLQWYGPSGLLAGQTTATLTKVDSAGYYYLVATQGGCSVSAGVNIKEYGIQDQRANIWYFGDNAGIDFNPLFDTPPGAAEAISNGVMTAPEGTSTMSDRNGQMLFFTDGVTVWDRTFTPIGTNIGGDLSATQSALIIPVAGNETLYYIFTTQQIYGGQYRLSYSLFDLTKGTNGALVKQNVTLFTKSTERITGNGNWLIAHEYGNNSFRAYQITQQGIGNPVISAIGSDHSTSYAENGQGYMKLGAQNRLAVTLNTPGVSNIIEVFDFADSSGTVSNLRTLNLNSTTGQVYGVEFGAGGNKLFATLSDATSKIYEFAFDTLGIPHEVKGPPKMSDAPVGERLGAIQTGPDGQLYVAADTKQYLGVITVNADTTRSSTFNASQFALLSGTRSRLGLPNFIQIISDPIQGPSISVTGLCLGDSTSFAGTGTDPIDTYTWQVTQGGSVITSSTDQNFNFLFTTAGLYDVVLEIRNRCGLDTVLTQQFRINGVPPDPSRTLALCNAPMTLDANPSNTPDITYLWGTGATTKTISISRPGPYTVTLTNTAGCTTDATLDVVPALTRIDFGPDQTVCAEAGTGTVLNTNINIQAHAWTINGAPVAPPNSGPTQNVDFGTAGTFEYAVAFTDALSTCVVRDTIVFTVNASPQIIFNSAGDINCGASNGSLAYQITQPTGAQMSYTVIGPSGLVTSGTNVAVPTGPLVTTATLPAGTYNMQATDQVSGCFTNAATTISTTDFTVTVTQFQPCLPGAINVATSLGAPGTYRVLNVNTGVYVVPANTPMPGTTFQTPALPEGDYLVEVTAPNACLVGENVSLIQGPETVVSFDLSQLCSSPAILTANGATTYDWSQSPAGSINGAANGASVQINPGTWNMVLVASDGANCPVTAQQTASAENLTVDFTFDACTDPVILTAAPSNNTSPLSSYIYRWSTTPPPTPAGLGQQFTATTAGNYILTMQSTVSGCNYVSPSKGVQLLGPLQATITTVNPPCNGEGAVFALQATTNRGVASYRWSLDGVIIGGETAAQLPGQNKAGLYSLHVSDGICETDASLDVDLLPSTPGQLPSLKLICPDHPVDSLRSVELNPGSSFTSYVWSTGSTDPTIIAASAGIYTVTLTNAFGCESKDQTDVQVECEPFLTAPNAFRPGSSLDVNSMFRVFTLFIDTKDFQVYIFNRWGEMVFASNERDFTWNGGYKNNSGQELPAGTYTYIVRYRGNSNTEDLGIKEKRGGVLLLR